MFPGPPSRFRRVRPNDRRRRRALVAACLWLVAVAVAAGAAPRPLVLDAVEITGNSRTPDHVVLRELGLSPGDTVTQGRILDAVAALQHSNLFESVEPAPRPGSRPGHVVLGLHVQERGPRWRLGTGSTDLDGWYLIPLELDLDNQFGRGEYNRLQLRFGYRHAGVVAHYLEGGSGSRPGWWGVDLGAVTTDRLYFLQGVEVTHRVDRTWASLRTGRWLGNDWWTEVSLRRESADAAPGAQVNVSDPAHGVEEGDPVPAALLPAAIRDAAGVRRRTLAAWRLGRDSRSRERWAATPVSGTWGRLRAWFTAQDAGPDYGAAELDLRLYRRAGPGVLAWRGLGAVVGRAAPFYDRLYLGGLYTVRGVPSQSLSPPTGDTWSWHSSLEYRVPLLGDPALPRLAGLLFGDVGRGGDLDAGPSHDPRAAVGWGLRYRLGPWITAGIDVGVPLGPTPTPDAFRVHAALEWGF